MTPRAAQPPNQLAAAELVTLDVVSSHWRVVFGSAHSALRAARSAGRSVGMDDRELHERDAKLSREQASTGELLDRLAHDEHVQLHHRLSAPPATRRMLGLSESVLACVFDLDGVLTATTELHAAAWAETFNELLARRVDRTGERFAPFRPFNPATDYDAHIHGKPRIQGVHAFLASRGIRLSEGHDDDATSAETVHGLANRKNEALLRRLDHEGVQAFAGSRRYLEAAREAGLLCAVVSASANTDEILDRAGLAALIRDRVDGNTIRSERLQSKPAPDTLLAAVRHLDVRPQEAVAFETTLDGISAARAAGLGRVVGVDRAGRGGRLQAAGADIVVTDLVELLDPTLAA